MGFPRLKRECGASLNARELTREKKVDMVENVQPKHSPNQETFKSEIHMYRFKKGTNLASLKSPVTIVKIPTPNREWGASLNTRELTREKKVDIGVNLAPKHSLNR